MEFAFTEEQEQFRDIVARFCRDKSPTPTVRRLAESEHGFDPAVWRQLCQEVGVAGIHLPEDEGGSGFGPIELGIVMEEFGRSLLPSPYFSCAVLAATAIAAMDDSSARDRLLCACSFRARRSARWRSRPPAVTRSLTSLMRTG
ncbi:MAG: acyl-CoA dehydrogenase family protein [Gammaproteobacteria bacterium]|nr:acyl-CoA dehydrogenase family protein [Gammaproteobacteria bacterium]